MKQPNLTLKELIDNDACYVAKLWFEKKYGKSAPARTVLLAANRFDADWVRWYFQNIFSAAKLRAFTRQYCIERGWLKNWNEVKKNPTEWVYGDKWSILAQAFIGETGIGVCSAYCYVEFLLRHISNLQLINALFPASKVVKPKKKSKAASKKK